MDGILQNGLRQLDTNALRGLLQQPRLLLPLQELVFTEGGAYWDTVPRSSEHLEVAAQVKSQVLSRIAVDTQPQKSVESAHDTTSVKTSTPTVRLPEKPQSGWRRNLIVAAALAASILLIVFATRPRSEGRFFARAGLLSSSESGNAFLQSLAAAIREDWKTNLSPDEFKKQLVDLRDSCDRLISANLPQLPATVAAQLKDRCRKWRATLTELLTALDQGKSSEQVQVEAQAVVDRLVQVIPTLG